METLILILKIVSQGLILVGGVWAILGRPAEARPDTGRKRLSGTGWVKLSMLVVGFSLFALSELQARRQVEARAARQAEDRAIQQRTIDNQADQLAYLRRLILTQHRISHLEIRLEYPDGGLAPFYDAIMRRPGRGGPEGADPTRLAYIGTACRIGKATATRRADDRWSLRYALNRPQGFVADQIGDRDPEWPAVAGALRELLSDRFDLLDGNGRVLASLTGGPPPREIRCERGAVAFVFRDTSIRFDDIAEAALTFEIDRQEPTFVPARVTFLSRDPRVQWDQAVDTRWRQDVVETYEITDTGQIGYLYRLLSGPHRVEAAFAGQAGR